MAVYENTAADGTANRGSELVCIRTNSK